MELNRQRTVSGLAPLPRSAGTDIPAQAGVPTEQPTTTSLQPPPAPQPGSPPHTPQHHVTLIRPPVTPQRVCSPAARDSPPPARWHVAAPPQQFSRSQTCDGGGHRAPSEQHATVHPRSSAATGTHTPTDPATPC